MADKKGRGAIEDRIRRQRIAAERRQHQQPSAPAEQPPPTRGRRPALRVAAALVLLGLLGLVGVGILGKGGSSKAPQLTSELVASTGAPLAVSGKLESYQLIYRVESFDDTGKGTVSTEEVNVRRPFDGHITSKAGQPPGAAVQWDLANVLGLVSDTSAGATPDVSRVPPGAPAGDIRVDATLQDLLDQHLFVSRERRRVLGRECQVYRTGQPLESAQVSAPSNSDYADACIDASGLLLEEMSVVAGKLALRTQAVEVHETPTFPEGTFNVQGTPTPLSQGGSELVEVDATKAPVGGYWEVTAPTGYQHVGRYLLRLPNPSSSSSSTSTAAPAPGASATTAPPAASAPPLESYVDVFSSGSSFVLVQQGVTASEPQPPQTQGAQADLGGLGKAQLNAGITGNTLAIHPADGWFVHVEATLPSAGLTQVGSTLHRAG